MSLNVNMQFSNQTWQQRFTAIKRGELPSLVCGASVYYPIPKIVVFFGPMFSSKTTKLIPKLRAARRGEARCLLIRHPIDYRKEEWDKDLPQDESESESEEEAGLRRSNSQCSTRLRTHEGDELDPAGSPYVLSVRADSLKDSLVIEVWLDDGTTMDVPLGTLVREADLICIEELLFWDKPVSEFQSEEDDPAKSIVRWKSEYCRVIYATSVNRYANGTGLPILERLLPDANFKLSNGFCCVCKSGRTTHTRFLEIEENREVAKTTGIVHAPGAADRFESVCSRCFRENRQRQIA